MWVLLGSQRYLRLMCSRYAVLYNLSPNFHLRMGTLQYFWVLSCTFGYSSICVGCFRYLRDAMNHMVLLHSSRPTFPCSSPSQLRETNELPFFVCSPNSLNVERFISILPLYHWQYSIHCRNYQIFQYTPCHQGLGSV